MRFTREQFHSECPSYHSVKNSLRNALSELVTHPSWANGLDILSPRAMNIFIVFIHHEDVPNEWQNKLTIKHANGVAFVLFSRCIVVTTFTTYVCLGNSEIIVNSTVYSGADQRKHRSSATLAILREISAGISRKTGQQRGICFHLMTSSCYNQTQNTSRVGALRRCLLLWKYLDIFRVHCGMCSWNTLFKCFKIS